MAITKKKLIDLLDKKGMYEETDEYLINEFMFCLERINEAKKDLKDRGNLVPIDKDGKLLGMNQSFSIYDKSLSNLMNISRKIGFSPRDRAEIKLEVQKDDIDL